MEILKDFAPMHQRIRNLKEILDMDIWWVLYLHQRVVIYDNLLLSFATDPNQTVQGFINQG